jgi:hypothetical protein
MSPEQRRYLFVECVIGSAVINALINGGLGWLGTIPVPVAFPTWKVPGVAADYLGTAFGVAFGTCIGAAVQVRVDTRRGRITPPTTVPPRLTAIISRLPRGLFARALVLGTACALALAPPILGGLLASGEPALARRSFIAIKAAFSALEGAVVTPLIVLAALLDLARPASPRI